MTNKFHFNKQIRTTIILICLKPINQFLQTFNRSFQNIIIPNNFIIIREMMLWIQINLVASSFKTKRSGRLLRFTIIVKN